MNKFQLHTEVCYTIDISGVSVLNKKTQKNTFITYPEAAVWLVLNQKYAQEISINLIGALLDDIEADSQQYMNNCISKWKDLGLVK